MDRDFTKRERDEHVVDLLSAYIDNALNPGERESVRAHIQSCTSCRAEHESLLATQVMLRSLPVVPPPRPFTLTQEMVGAGARRESFWQRILTPSAVPRFATGSVVAFALLVMLLVGDLAGVRQNATYAPVAATSSGSAPEGAGLVQNNDVAVQSAPADDTQRNAYLIPPSADATTTTGAASDVQADSSTGNAGQALEATPATLAMEGAPQSSPTVSIPEVFVAKQASPSDGQLLGYDPSSSGSRNTLPAFELVLAAIGTLLAVGALVARRRGA